MNWAIFRLTLQELSGKRRLALVGLLAALPSLVSVAYRLGDQTDEAAHWTANTLYDSVIITILLPLVALIFGISSLGSEIEDGTVMHLLAKPLPRSQIIIAKLAVAWLLTALFVAPATAVSGIIAVQGSADHGIVLGFIVASLFGALAYVSLFVMLSVYTSKALFVGLGYVFVWEGIVTNLFSGSRYLSVHQCCLGVADLVSSANDATFQAELSGVESVIILAIAIAVSLYMAVRTLEVFQVGQST